MTVSHEEATSSNNPARSEPLLGLPDPDRRELLGAMLDAVPTGLALINKEGCIVLVNQRLLELTGYPAEMLVGCPVEVLLPVRSRALHPAMLQAFFRNPEARPMGAGRELYAARRDGSEFPIEIALTPVLLRGDTMVLATMIDITERRNATLALERARDEFNVAIEAAPTGIVMVDEVGRITLVNRQLERMFGHDRRDLIGAPIEVLLPARVRTQHPALVRAFINAPQNRPMGLGRDLYAARRDGSEFAVEVGLSPVDTLAGPRVLATIVDISARKSIETKLRAMNSSLEEFANLASHDLRAPLRGIAELLEWIKQDLNDGKHELIANHIARAELRVTRAEQLIDDLFAYSKAGQAATEFVDTTTHEIIQRAFDLAGAPSHFDFQVNGVPVDVYIERTPLETVLRNLIGNAVRHHDKSTGVVSVVAGTVGPFVEFVIEDDGPGGVAGAARNGMYLQPGRSSSTGLGLATAMRLCTTHGGRIDIEEREDARGTRARVYWPYRVRREHAPYEST